MLVSQYKTKRQFFRKRQFLIVADLYLNVNRQSGELYHESYDCVAVMFATVADYAVDILHDDESLLLLMNQIIGDFDKVNTNYT